MNRRWIIIVTEDQHLVTPYILTDNDFGDPMIFYSERTALSYLAENVRYGYGKIFEYEVK
jgi:hypothetical protein